jgi:glycosyltransferase involved in cell wall biosynthesis
MTPASIRSDGFPTIAAVIINYNYAPYVADAIESVLRQRPAFDEIIVIDDGSTDHSLEVIRPYTDRLKLITKPNGGQMTASIIGINEASSEYIYILDADDFVLDCFLSNVLPAITSLPVKAQFQLMGIGKDKRSLGSLFPAYPAGYDDAAMREDNRTVGFYTTPPTSGNVYRRETLAALDLTILPGNDPIDGAPNLAMPYLGKVVSTNVPVACYRVHGSNAWGKFTSPDCARLEWEMEWLHQHWRAVCRLIGLSNPPFGMDEPLALRQLKLMNAALGDGSRLCVLVYRYICRLPDSHMKWSHKIALTLWAVTLLTPGRRLRKKLVFARRSPVNRPRLLQRVVRVLQFS